MRLVSIFFGAYLFAPPLFADALIDQLVQKSFVSLPATLRADFTGKVITPQNTNTYSGKMYLDIRKNRVRTELARIPFDGYVFDDLRKKDLGSDPKSSPPDIPVKFDVYSYSRYYTLSVSRSDASYVYLSGTPAVAVTEAHTVEIKVELSTGLIRELNRYQSGTLVSHMTITYLPIGGFQVPSRLDSEEYFPTGFGGKPVLVQSVLANTSVNPTLDEGLFRVD